MVFTKSGENHFSTIGIVGRESSAKLFGKQTGNTVETDLNYSILLNSFVYMLKFSE